MLPPSSSRRILAIAALTAGLAPALAQAHFVLQSPPAVYDQGPLGDPQKAPPCGADGNEVATGMVTAYQAGDTITVTINETIFHPGHYRIALVSDLADIPAEPPVTAGAQACGTTLIQDPPVFPVLADGVFLHDAPFGGPQSIDVTVPDGISCTNCTLQVIQFMSAHGLNNPGGCFYHHCAAVSVEGGAVETSTSSDGSTSSQAESSSGAASVTGEQPTSGGGNEGTAAGSDGSSSDGASDDSKGCGCASTNNTNRLAPLAAMLGLLGLRTRRRRA
ncbi:SCE4755 family polysaccharide monooxygenase-like protein [Nannocystis sp.]|uniref:SCE4755 family polysaccharide monooxygenase-like protein n=1 Tax=Nannocystis sp. TaxID=1962667 RepID=UPI002421AF01|nr:SCE4755 family polysaccharide monooxygenase-like protein [Nannocystis sp.]MBK7826572.1 hypothetical protein [Nannocystis sp.]MBK9754195.1 hypothetical protein [Nannocystis sp.]